MSALKSVFICGNAAMKAENGWSCPSCQTGTVSGRNPGAGTGNGFRQNALSPAAARSSESGARISCPHLHPHQRA